MKASCQQCQTPAAVYCTAEAAFFCGKCDDQAHGTNAMTAALHVRHVLCDLCEKAPATIFCKNDDAKLCPACDAQIHVSNPLAARHERVALSALSFPGTQHSVCTGAPLVSSSLAHSSSAGSLSDLQVQAVPEFGLEFEPVAKAFKDFDAFDLEGDLFDMGMGFDLGTLDMDFLSTPNKHENSDGVVPNLEQSSCCSSENDSISEADGCVLQSSSISSADTFQAKAATSTSAADAIAAMPAVPARPVQAAARVWSPASAPLEVLHIGADVPMNREARVMRYRQKRARRTFQKTIRYQSRKAYAEIRPRIKGRFATREEVLALKAEQARQVAAAAAPTMVAC